MAHFAEIDENNIVLRVLVVPDDQQDRGQEFMADDLGLGGTWIQTSYNTFNNQHRLGGTPLHYNYAGVGHVWDPVKEGFHGQQPFPSWVLDENLRWQPPVERPDTGHSWDEETTSWVKPEKPFESHVWLTVEGLGFWIPPVDYPSDGKYYKWDEPSVSWVETEELIEEPAE